MTAITRQAPGRTRVSFPHAMKDTLVITKRNLLRNVRLPQLLFFATVQPVMFLLLFNFVFGGAIGGSLPAVAGGNYLNWLVPGLLIQVASFMRTWTVATRLSQSLELYSNPSGAISRIFWRTVSGSSGKLMIKPA